MGRHTPPLVALRAFEAAARLLSFALAAEELSVTPAAISHQVKRLEEHLGIRLFERQHRNVVLTEPGNALAKKLTAIFIDLDSALDAVPNLRQRRIRISAMPSLAARWLAPRLQAFGEMHPDLQLSMDETDELVTLERDNMDIALRYGAGAYPGVHAELLMEAGVCAVCSPAYLARTVLPLLEPADLRHHTLLHDQTSMKAAGVPNWRTWLDAAGAHGVDWTRGPSFSAIHLALQASLSGHGVALAPEPLVADDMAAGRLVKPFGYVAPNAFAFWLVCQNSMMDDATVQAFRRWVIGEAEATRARIGGRAG